MAKLSGSRTLESDWNSGRNSLPFRRFTIFQLQVRRAGATLQQEGVKAKNPKIQFYHVI